MICGQKQTAQETGRHSNGAYGSRILGGHSEVSTATDITLVSLPKCVCEPCHESTCHELQSDGHGNAMYLVWLVARSSNPKAGFAQRHGNDSLLHQIFDFAQGLD